MNYDGESEYFEDIDNDMDPIEIEYMDFIAITKEDHTINSSVRQTFKRGSFVKQMS